MALLTLGTNANNSLSAIKFVAGANGMAAADVASLNALIRGQNAVQPRVNGYFTTTGLLHLPGGRGIIQMQPGDYAAVDSVGWPTVYSAYAIANGPYTHS